MLNAILLLALAACDDKEAEDALERFKAAYKNSAPAARATAVTAATATLVSFSSK